MRIGIFTDQYLPNISGQVTSVINLKAGLEARGHEVYIIAPAHKRQIPEKNVIRVFSVDPMVFLGNPFAIPTRGKLKQLIDMKFDIVHVQEMFSIGALGHAVAKRTGVPLILTVHTQWDQLFKHYPASVLAAAVGVSAAFPFYFGMRSTLSVYLREDGGEAGIISRQFGRNLVVFANQCDYVISPSVHVLDKLKRFRCKAPIAHIPNSVSTEKVVKTVDLPSSKPGSIRFTMLGRVSREKRQYIAIQAFARAIKQVDAELFIVGDGPDLERCQQLVGELGVEDSVHFLGHQNNAVAKQLLASSDVMLLASYNFDNQPMVILESLAVGTAMLYCDPNLKDGLDRTNALLSGHTIAGLRDGIVALASDPKRIKLMKQSSKKLAKQYSVEKIASRVEAIYQEARALS